MRYLQIIPVPCCFLFLCACNSGEKEHRRLSEELKAIDEENSYLKAQTVGLTKKRERLQTKFEEDRRALEMKFEKQEEALLKKTPGASKKDSAGKKKAHQKERHQGPTA
jgi:predicted nuclease with TOPRIM domain